MRTKRSFKPRTFLVSQEELDAMTPDKHYGVQTYGTCIRVGDNFYTTSHRVPYDVCHDIISELPPKEAVEYMQSQRFVYIGGSNA